MDSHHGSPPTFGDVLDDIELKKRDSASTADGSERKCQVPSRKRRKTEQQSSFTSTSEKIRKDVQKSAEKLRREGICPDTLFFPSLPEEMRGDENLRLAMGIAFEDLKTTQKGGKHMAWVRFANEGDCMDTLLRLRLATPSMKVSIHRPKNTTDANGTNLFSKNLVAFQQRLQEIRANGGIGNTLMFRNLPKEVECDELRNLLQSAATKAQCHEQCVPLRIRTALSKDGRSRNFWVVYSSVGACQNAFASIHLTFVNFKCGRSLKIRSFVHDDSTDADEKRRRERNLNLGMQGNVAGNEGTFVAPKLTDLELLEAWLRQQQSSFVFMSPRMR